MSWVSVFAALVLLGQTPTATTSAVVDAGTRQVIRPGQASPPPSTKRAGPHANITADGGIKADGGITADRGIKADRGITADRGIETEVAEPKPRPAPRPAPKALPIADNISADADADAGSLTAASDAAPVGDAARLAAVDGGPAVAAQPADAGLAASSETAPEASVPGWLLDLVERARTPPAIETPVGPDQGPPLPSEPAEPFSALWLALALILVVFGGLRVAAFFVRRAARRETGWALALSRGWLFVEAIVWLLVAVWLVNRFFFAQTGLTATLITGLVLLVVALGFGPLRDVLAGLVLSMERPFGVGDRVQIADEEGRVVAFHLRVLELVTSSQETLRIPYRKVAESTSARSAVPRRAHPVRRSFGLPEGVDPNEALKAVRELALASPWAVLGFAPEVELERGVEGEQLRVVAFAFATEAESWLAADLEAGWREASRRWSQG